MKKRFYAFVVFCLILLWVILQSVADFIGTLAELLAQYIDERIKNGN